MPNAGSDKPWLQDFEQMLSRWAAHVRAQAEAGEQSPAAAALLDELLRSWAAFVQQPDDARRAGQPPADWLARAASGGPPAHWLAYIREKAPHLLDESGELRLTMGTAVPPTAPALPPIAADMPQDTVATPPVTDAQPPDPPPAAAKPVATAVITTPPAPDLPPPAALEKTSATRPSTVRLSPAPLPSVDTRPPTAVPAPTPTPTPRPAHTPPDEKGAADETHAVEPDLPPAPPVSPPVLAAKTPPEIVSPVSAAEITREPVGRTAVSPRQPLQLKPVSTRPPAVPATPATPAHIHRPKPTQQAIHYPPRKWLQFVRRRCSRQLSQHSPTKSQRVYHNGSLPPKKVFSTRQSRDTAVSPLRLTHPRRAGSSLLAPRRRTCLNQHPDAEKKRPCHPPSPLHPGQNCRPIRPGCPTKRPQTIPRPGWFTGWH
ncbi:MAG: hypothetical protein IPG51_04590 [Chloroflexi bacterium]|nr:hypothetical protein [Chloroflexota bacterium]